MTTSKPDAQRLLPIAAIAAPLLTVIGARVMLSAGPAEAPAADLPDQFLPSDQAGPVAPAATLTPQQAAAAEFARSIAARADIVSPMVQPKPEESAPPTRTVASTTTRPVDPRELLVLNSIVGTGDRAIASIDNRLYRVGDEPLPGWTIELIDTAGRRLVLRHPSAGRAELSYRPPTPLDP